MLIARARALHQDVNFEENFQSRFRKDNAARETCRRSPAACAASQSGRGANAAKRLHPQHSPFQVVAAAPVAPKAAPPIKNQTQLRRRLFRTKCPRVSTSSRTGTRRAGALGKGLARALVILAQPVLGALPHDAKKKIEAAVQSPWFSVAGSTGLNIAHNAVIYRMGLHGNCCDLTWPRIHPFQPRN